MKFPVSIHSLLLAATTVVAIPKPQGGGGNEGGSGPYTAHYTTIPALPDHTVYLPIEVPADLTLPVLIWGNGACSADGTMFLNLLNQVASHGFFVLASGTPGGSGSTTSQLMADALDWVSQNAGSGDYAFIDASRVSVSGQSCGGLEAYDMVGDERVGTIGIFNSGFLDEGEAQSVVPGITKPTFYFLGGESDIAYPNGERDYTLLPEGTPTWKGNLPVGHGGTFSDPDAGKFGVAAVNYLLWTLKGDTTAAEFFTGQGAEGDGWSVESKNLEAIEVAPL
ncbi:hypothetical protein AJ79_00582 [Helicocarpus griseus UAMH5409]|uniref:Chlorophyllase n=1 Tax=Helicocarpus griseus UAMH5409 TaxID=1447875 RepID=A0A2B7YB32_9EURO|nr:hypothetical protein AJ79_00582 [Helicocarpus griseus UAMH5409]